MCLLSYYPPGVMPDREHIENGCTYNEDGFGWAIVVPADDNGLGARLIVGKSLNAGEAVDGFLRARGNNPYGPALFHSRLSTGGTEDTYNCHPFQVGHDPETVVAHNGILFSVDYKEKKSDTRIFAERIMPKQYKRLDKPGVQRAFHRHLGTYNKMVVLTVNPRYKSYAYLFNEEAGHWTTDGEWHSNLDYLSPAPIYRRSFKGGSFSIDAGTSWMSDDEWWEYQDAKANEEWAKGDKDGQSLISRYMPDPLMACDTCLATGTIDPDTFVCIECKTCQECGKDENDCPCFALDAFEVDDMSDDDPPWSHPSKTRKTDKAGEEIATIDNGQPPPIVKSPPATFVVRNGQVVRQ